jgi:hypothetical protein
MILNYFLLRSVPKGPKSGKFKTRKGLVQGKFGKLNPVRTLLLYEKEKL